MKLVYKLFVVVSAVFSLTTFSAHAAIDPAASSVLLRTSCDDGAGGTLNNCFNSPGALMNWIKGTRYPSATDTLAVDIGPGIYQRIEWLCAPGAGHVSFRGAGRGRTLFTNNDVLGNAMTFQNCQNLTFDSMTIDAKFISVVWAGKGNATWTDVELVAGYATWYETPANQLASGSVCPSGVNNEHKFFSSSLILKNPTIGALIYLNNCGVTWFFGSELVLDVPSTTWGGVAEGVKSSGAGHEVHLYGSNIRLFSGDNSAVAGLVAFNANTGGQIHVHGTGIDVISTKDIPVTALQASTNGGIHADESSYVMRTGAGGSVTRVSNNGGHVHGVYLWMHVPDTDGNPATVDTNYFSVNGADQTFVKTGTSDGHPHPAVYSDACPAASRWYDTVDQVCRGQ